MLCPECGQDDLVRSRVVPTEEIVEGLSRVRRAAGLWPATPGTNWMTTWLLAVSTTPAVVEIDP